MEKIKYFVFNFWNYFWRIPPFSIFYRAYYLFRASWPVWFYVLNKAPREYHRKHRSNLNQIQKRTVEDLTRFGIGSAHFSDMFPELDFSLFQKSLAEAMLIGENQKQIEEQSKGQSAQSKKYYLVELWKKPFHFDFANPFMSLAASERILTIVNHYLEMAAHLSYLNLWYTVPMEKAANYSQRWHRDPDDRRLVKLFLYLNDVDENSGPFHYVSGSHDQGPHRNVLPSRPPYSTYPKEGEVEKLISKDDIRQCTGRAGTLIFCDTRGLHKGGHATKNPRILFNAVYLTEGAIPSEKRKINYILNQPNRTHNPLADYALSWAESS